MEKISFDKIKKLGTPKGKFANNIRSRLVKMSEDINTQLDELCVAINRDLSDSQVLNVFPDTFINFTEHNIKPKLSENNMLLKQVIVFRYPSYDVALYIGNYESIEELKKSYYEDLGTELKKVENEIEEFERKKISANSGKTFGRARR